MRIYEQRISRAREKLNEAVKAADAANEELNALLSLCGGNPETVYQEIRTLQQEIQADLAKIDERMIPNGNAS